MKKKVFPLYVHVGVYAVVLFVVLWLLWYVNYKYLLTWYEGFDFFSTSSDMMFLSALFPRDIFAYIGSFLLQFYYYPSIGAAIQSAFAVGVMLCAVVAVTRLLADSKHALWIALLPVPFFVGGQFEEFYLSRSLLWLSLSMVMAVLVSLLTVRKRGFVRLPSFMLRPVCASAASVVILLWSAYNLLYKEESPRQYNQFFHMEYLADRGQWDDLLKIATPAEAATNDMARHYALLALLEKGKLPDCFLIYGATNRGDFYFPDNKEPFCLSFNALLYRSLGLPNRVIENTFQQQFHSTFGTSFATLRRMADTMLDMQNYPMARKYLDILSHSTLMSSWAEDRRPRLEAIKGKTPVYRQEGEQVYTSDLMQLAAEMYNRYPDERRYADLLLSGLLAERLMEEFYSAFEIIAPKHYAHGERVPRCYEEALMIVSTGNPGVLDRFHVSGEVQRAFDDVRTLARQGDIAQLQTLLPNSYWTYFYSNIGS